MRVLWEKKRERRCTEAIYSRTPDVICDHVQEVALHYCICCNRQVQDDDAPVDFTF